MRCAKRDGSLSSCRNGRAAALSRRGGGLGVDYDGSQTNFSSSMNYSLQEYANDIVYNLMELCDAAGIAHPTIVSESGRAIVAHHAVLVVDVLGSASLPSARFRNRCQTMPRKWSGTCSIPIVM